MTPLTEICPMSSTILAPTDFSDKSAHALRLAASYATAYGAKLCCLHVVEELDEGSSWLLLVEPPEQIERDVVQARQTRLDDFVARHLPGDFPSDRLEKRVVVGSAIDEILATSRQIEDTSLIVVGSVGHGVVMATFLGSTANQLVRQSPLPVMVVPPDERHDARFEHILAPVDDSSASKQSLHIAAKFAQTTGGKVTALHAMDATLAGAGDPGFPVYIGPGTLEALAQQRQLWLDELAAHDPSFEGVVTATKLSYDDPAQAIDDFASQENVDLICIGSHGRRGVRRFLLGNTAERVLRKAPCPVLVIPATDD